MRSSAWDLKTARMLRATLLMLGCATHDALAQTALESGWWWNPAEGGRGYFIEQQAGRLFLAAYLYAEDGQPTWLVADLDSDGGAYEGTLLGFRGGQTLTGAWRANTRVVPDPGTIRIVPGDRRHARLTWPGGTQDIERFALVAGGLEAPPADAAPETGWWWNPAEGGRGFGIEVQNGVMLVGGYMYAADGAPVWYLSGQAPMSDASHYRGGWARYVDGQTLTGSYRPATRQVPDVGNVELSFDSSISATLRLPDGRLSTLQRFAFASTTRLDWTPGFSASPVAVEAALPGLESSSRLRLHWQRPVDGAIERYELAVTDLLTGELALHRTAATNLQLDGLKASTGYRIELIPCSAGFCHLGQAASVEATTAREVWQLQGSGRTVGGLRRSVADGNVKIHAVRFGSDAPASVANRVQLYYGAMGPTVRGLATALGSSAVDPAQPSSYLDFSSRAGLTGLISPPSAAPWVRDVATGQAVPLTGNRLRLYFEASGSDNRTRILSIDAKDGGVGQDFNSGAATTCAISADYSSGGGCEPQLVIGVEGDGALGNPRIINARQFKIGWPTQDDWRWAEDDGSWMVFTVDAVPGCSTAGHNQAYAVLDATTRRWIVQYDSATACPLMFRHMQAAHPLHLGGGRYQLIYGDTSDLSGALPGSNLPFLGRKRVLYADARRSGDPARVDFADWEPSALGRRVAFHWPDGTLLDATAEGYIDDFSVIAPAGDPAHVRVLYVAITDGRAAPVTASAILLNP